MIKVLSLLLILLVSGAVLFFPVLVGVGLRLIMKRANSNVLALGGALIVLVMSFSLYGRGLMGEAVGHFFEYPTKCSVLSYLWICVVSLSAISGPFILVRIGVALMNKWKAPNRQLP